MRCPYCQNSLPSADAPECPACRLTFPRTSALVGAVPRLTPQVADTTQSIAAADQTKLKRRIQVLHQRFPELSVQLVMHHFPAEHPFAMHAFWLFNAGAFASDSRRGNENHAILIVMDPLRGEAAIMPGYGLETLLKEDATAHLLELSAPAWQQHRWTEGFLTLLNGLEKLLESIAQPAAIGKESDADF